MEEQVLLVMTNLPDQPAAQAMARALVGAGLTACVNILPGVQSVYRWQGKVEEASEVTLLVKTTKARYAQLQQAIVAAHPYDVPEVIAWPLAHGYLPYLHWVAAETGQGDHA
jgi:periplasmic divalent cation tolerance protein